MVAFTMQRVSVRGTPLRAVSNGSRTVMAADRPIWLPGNDFPKRKWQNYSKRAILIASHPARPTEFHMSSPEYADAPSNYIKMQIWRAASCLATMASVSVAFDEEIVSLSIHI
jgi:hypothetical protein